MAKPSSRTELIDYCLRSLGEPVTQINVDQTQLDDRLDEALQYYQTYHADAVVQTYVKHEVTQDDLDNDYIILDDSILSVIQVLGLDAEGSGVFGYRYQMHMNDLLMGRTSGIGNIVDYEIQKQHMGMVGDLLNGHGSRLTYSMHKDRVTFHSGLKDRTAVGQFIIFQAYQTVDPTEFTQVYDDMALKEYLTLLIKRQWGQNISKFEGMQLPGGITLNGRAIYEEANSDLKELRAEWILNFSAPDDFFVG